MRQQRTNQQRRRSGGNPPPRQPRQPRRRRNRLRGPGWLLLLLLLGGSGWLGLRYAPATPPLAQPLSASQPASASRPQEPAASASKSLLGADPVHLLLLGTDAEAGADRTDTIMVLTAHLAARRLSLLSIPRDTRVQLADGAHKINALYHRGGAALLAQAVANATQLPLHHVVRVDLAGFERLVDALGGVELAVEKRMRYTDRAQDLRIDLQPGKQRLDGRRAMQYVRFRKDAEGDLGRIRRQQKFLQAVAAALRDPHRLQRLPAVVQAVAAGVETTLSPAQVLALGHLVSQTQLSELQTGSLPGSAKMIGGVSYFIASPTAAAEVHRAAAPRPAAPVADPSLRPVVTVYNGSDRLGLERLVAQQLRQRGYPALAAPQAMVDQEAHSRLYGATAADLAAAQRVGNALGVPASSHPTPSRCPNAAVLKPGEAGVVLVLGADWRD
ncbi:MAG: LCP family protein [Fimbriimonadaceae bacterium]|nr:LCP family protein [Fimbriimonadaceae bacterium]